MTWKEDLVSCSPLSQFLRTPSRPSRRLLMLEVWVRNSCKLTIKSSSRVIQNAGMERLAIFAPTISPRRSSKRLSNARTHVSTRSNRQRKLRRKLKMPLSVKDRWLLLSIRRKLPHSLKSKRKLRPRLRLLVLPETRPLTRRSTAVHQERLAPRDQFQRRLLRKMKILSTPRN